MPHQGLLTQVVVVVMGDLVVMIHPHVVMVVMIHLHVVEVQDRAMGLLHLHTVIGEDLEDRVVVVMAMVVVVAEVVEDLVE